MSKPKEDFLDADEMAAHYKAPTRAAFMQRWRRDRKHQTRTIPDPVTQDGAKKKLWRKSDVDRLDAAKRAGRG